MSILSKGNEEYPRKRSVRDFKAFRGFVTRNSIPALTAPSLADKLMGDQSDENETATVEPKDKV